MIRDKELQSKLNNQIRYVLKHSNFYKNKFGSLAISETEQDFLDLPFTTKSEILEDQLSNPPFGNNLCVNVSKIQRIHKTSGTTARPLLLALTANDVKHAVQCGAKSFQLSGLTSEHIVIHCLNYNLWSGGYTDHQSLEVAGAGVIPFGVGHTKELIQTIINIKPTAIHCTPSYLKKIESVLIEEFGMLPSDLGLNLGLFGGESGMQNKDFRERIENVWQIKAMNANYGLSDVLSIFGSECFCQNGLHFTGSEVLYPELIDYKTLESVKIREGAIGELVLTNLHKESQPLIRYRTNDIIEIISMEKCKCNETGFRFNVIGRSDDMICIKGVNVFVSAIDKIIYNNSDTLTGQYHININAIEPIDRIQIVIELKNEQKENTDSIRHGLLKKFNEGLYIHPEIIIVPAGSLPLSEGKTKKVFRTL